MDAERQLFELAVDYSDQYIEEWQKEGNAYWRKIRTIVEKAFKDGYRMAKKRLRMDAERQEVVRRPFSDMTCIKCGKRYGAEPRLCWHCLKAEAREEAETDKARLIEALNWITDRYKKSLSGKAVRDADEVIIHSENLLAEMERKEKAT